MSLPELTQGATDIDVTVVVTTTPYAGSAVTAAVLRVRNYDGTVRTLTTTIEDVGDTTVTLRHVTDADSLPAVGEVSAAVWVTIGGIERETAERPILRVIRRNIPRS